MTLEKLVDGQRLSSKIRTTRDLLNAIQNKCPIGMDGMVISEVYPDVGNLMRAQAQAYFVTKLERLEAEFDTL